MKKGATVATRKNGSLDPEFYGRTKRHHTMLERGMTFAQMQITCLKPSYSFVKAKKETRHKTLHRKKKETKEIPQNSRFFF